MEIPKHDDKDIFHKPTVKRTHPWNRRDVVIIGLLWVALVLITGFFLMDAYLAIRFWEGSGL
jgi:hypothetical protein